MIIYLILPWTCIEIQMFIQSHDDPLKKREAAVQGLRSQRRKEIIQEKIDNFNQTHSNYQIRLFAVPYRLTFDQFKYSHVFPYRSANKLKSIYNNFEQANLLNRMTTADINKLSKHYNNFNVKKNKQEYSLKTYSNVRHSLIGDIFFYSDISYLLLININTRYAYAYQLGDVEIHKISNKDEYQNNYFIYYATR